MLKVVMFVCLFLNSSFAEVQTSKQITLDWLSQQPKSYAKDFYIWRYLDKDITSKQADEALKQVRHLSAGILSRYIDRSNHQELKEYKSCQNKKTTALLQEEPFCIEAGLSIYKATQLSKKDLETVIKKVEVEYPKFALKLAVLHAKNPFEKLQKSESEIFFGVFNQCGGVYRTNHFDQHFSKELLDKLQTEKEFAQTVKLIVTNLSMKKAQQSLLGIDATNLDYKTTFHLAINAIQNNKEKIALGYLADAYKKAYFKIDKDNILFWQYQLTLEKKYLEELANSWDVNIYTLYANEQLGGEQKNIIYTLEQKNSPELHYDIQNPFEWLKVLDDTKNVDEKKLIQYQNIFTSKDTLGHLAFVYERYDRYKNSYFVLPFQEELGALEKQRQALIYAIARQESRFIPTSISTAYAMGVMQIMPFLSKAIAKELKEPYDIDQQLDAKTNLRYGDHHLDFLERRLDNPLFVAYAYNGGIGFTRRTLKTGLFGQKKYEPWLSMEMLTFDETKHYGKKVLANYLIYYNYLHPDQKITLDSLLAKISN